MSYPADLLYSASHEWVKIEGDEAVVGITFFAQESLGDITYVELPAAGDTVTVDKEFGSVLDGASRAEPGLHHTSSPPWIWKTAPWSSPSKPSSSQQVMKTWPPVMRWRTNSCRRRSSSLSTSSSSSTGHSPVSW